MCLNVSVYARMGMGVWFAVDAYDVILVYLDKISASMMSWKLYFLDMNQNE